MGGVGDFHFNKINLLASRVANATKSALNLGITMVEGKTPNRIVTEIGSMGTFSISDRVLQMSVQKLWRDGPSGFSKLLWVGSVCESSLQKDPSPGIIGNR